MSAAVHISPVSGKRVTRQCLHQFRNLARLKCRYHRDRDCVDGATLCAECREKSRLRRAASYKRGPHVSKSTWGGVDWSKPNAQIAAELGVCYETVLKHRETWANGVKPSEKFTYFALTPSNGRVKIGVTHSVQSRLREISKANHCEVPELLCSLPHAEWPEVFVHKMFRADRIEGEWFRYSDHMKAFIASLQEDNSRS